MWGYLHEASSQQSKYFSHPVGLSHLRACCRMVSSAYTVSLSTVYSHYQKDARLKSLMADDAKLRSHTLLTKWYSFTAKPCDVKISQNNIRFYYQSVFTLLSVCFLSLSHECCTFSSPSSYSFINDIFHPIMTQSCESAVKLSMQHSGLYLIPHKFAFNSFLGRLMFSIKVKEKHTGMRPFSQAHNVVHIKWQKLCEESKQGARETRSNLSPFLTSSQLANHNMKWCKCHIVTSRKKADIWKIKHWCGSDRPRKSSSAHNLS